MYKIQIKLPNYLFNSQGQRRFKIVQHSSEFVLNDKTVVIRCENKKHDTDPNEFVADQLFNKVFRIIDMFLYFIPPFNMII